MHYLFTATFALILALGVAEPIVGIGSAVLAVYAVRILPEN